MATIAAMKTDFSEIVRQLAARADELVADLLPAGYREGAEWRCGSVAESAATVLERI